MYWTIINSSINSKHNTDIEESNFNCDFCNKFFSIKSTLKSHLETCKVKKENEFKNNITTYEETIQMQRNEIRNLNSSINSLQIEHKYKINSLKNEYEDYIKEQKEIILKLTYELTLQKELYQKLEKDCEYYKQNNTKFTEKITSELINRPTTIYQSNNNNNSKNEYNIQFNEMVKNLVPFINSTNIVFFPQGLLMLLYGTLGFILTIYWSL